MTLLPTPGLQHQDPEVGTTAGKPPVFQGPRTRHFRGNFNEGRLASPHTRDLPQQVQIVCGFMLYVPHFDINGASRLVIGSRINPRRMKRS